MALEIVPFEVDWVQPKVESKPRSVRKDLHRRKKSLLPYRIASSYLRRKCLLLVVVDRMFLLLLLLLMKIEMKLKVLVWLKYSEKRFVENVVEKLQKEPEVERLLGRDESWAFPEMWPCWIARWEWHLGHMSERLMDSIEEVVIEARQGLNLLVVN